MSSKRIWEHLLRGQIILRFVPMGSFSDELPIEGRIQDFLNQRSDQVQKHTKHVPIFFY